MLLLKKYQWGISVKPDTDDMEEALIYFINNIEKYKFLREDVEQFSYKNIALTYANLIIEIENNNCFM